VCSAAGSLGNGPGLPVLIRRAPWHARGGAGPGDHRFRREAGASILDEPREHILLAIKLSSEVNASRLHFKLSSET
jgi:hypothetical protein